MKMTLMQHFTELRRRMLWSVFVFIFAFCFGWIIAPYTELFLIQPLLNIWDGATLLYTKLTDGLMIRFSLSTLVALIITIPVLLWHIWAYMAPGLHKNEKQFLIPIFFISPMLFIIGVGFAFYVLFPFVFKFFLEISKTTNLPTVLLPAAKEYLSFAIDLLKVFGVAFQLPLVMIILNKIGILSRTSASKCRRYVIVFIFIAAAVLTPPDIVSQILLAVPMWMLFEISLLFMRNDS